MPQPKKYKTEKERLAADALRKRLARQNEPEAKRKIRLEKHAAAARRRRQVLQNDNGNGKQDSADALRKKLARQNEPEAKRKIRLEKHAAAARRRRQRLQNDKGEGERDSSEPEINLEAEQKRIKNRDAQRRFREARRQLLTVQPDQYEAKLKEMTHLQESTKVRILKSLDPQKIEDQRDKQRFKRQLERVYMTEEEKEQNKMKEYLRRQARQARMSKEELIAHQEKIRLRQDAYRKSLSGEKLQRYKESLNRSVKKTQKSEKFRQRMKKRYEEILERETPKQRLQRLKSYRISQAKKLLKKKMETAGASPETIQAEVEKLVEKMKAEPLPETASSYKPRQRKTPRKVVTGRTSGGNEATTSNKVEEHPRFPSWLHNSLGSRPDHSHFECQIKPSIDEASPPPSPEAIEDDNVEHFEDSPNDSTVTAPIFIASTTDSTEPIETSFPVELQTKTWNCPKCKKTVYSAPGLSEHYKKFHKAKPAEKESQERLKSRNINPEKKLCSFICMKCVKISSKSVFQGKDKLLAHVKQKHSKFYFPCLNCNLLKYRSAKLELHYKVCRKISMKRIK